ncbi:MAG TPA: PEP-CTERM sorting domain-containing protein [Bryobacteraceae bacterium]|nr:PEP-CTERM sorting domain-containing protein [Bryobacteraceae bacterium]
MRRSLRSVGCHFWIGTLALLGWSATARMANASALFFSGLQFNNPVFATGQTDVSISNASVNAGGGSYSYSAEFCVNGDCSFQPGGATNTSNLKLAGLSLFCNAEGVCGPLDVTFQAGFDVSPGSNETIGVSLGNTSFSGSAFSGFARICFSDMDHICAADLTGTSSFSFSFSSAGFSGSQAGVYVVGAAGPFQMNGIFHIDGLANGGSINLGQSLDINTQQSSFGGGGIPEPATLFLLPAGVAAIFALRRIRAQRRGAGCQPARDC